MYLLKTIYEKIHNKPLPCYYNYSIGTILFNPIRKMLINTLVVNCPFDCIRTVIYRMCDFKIGKGIFIGMRTNFISKNVNTSGGASAFVQLPE